MNDIRSLAGPIMVQLTLPWRSLVAHHVRPLSIAYTFIIRSIYVDLEGQKYGYPSAPGRRSD